ncbi:hypothetical protein N0V88_006605 [Collariella sp. IMI 366227]|nr:hypothetical protein N0V88_006605 [Collariella sp. IMI 366227]
MDKAAVTQTEDIRPRRRGCVGHCKKFWWAYLALLVVIVVIVVPVILLVAVPKIAQGKLDDAKLFLDSTVISNTQTKSLTMKLDTTIKSDGSVHAKIAGFPGVMYLEDYQPHTPFAKIDFPQTTSDAHQVVNVTQDLPIEDEAALTRFNTWLLSNETVRVTVEGETHVRVKGIARNYGVTFRSTLDTPGMRGLDGTVVNDTRASLEHDALDNNFWGMAYIPNHSVFNIELGNLTYINYLLGKEIGTVYIDNVVLNSGMNKFPMRATITDLGAVLEALGTDAFCKGDKKGILPLQIRCSEVVNHGQPLPYFANALGAHNQTIEIDIGGTVKKMGLDIPCGGL